MIDSSKLDFTKLNGLIPAIIIDSNTEKILMLGFMNEEALRNTIETKKVTFYSRSRNKIWTKGETSGNYLHLKDIITDCDNDAVIVYAEPEGATCHTGDYSCFGFEKNNLAFLEKLEILLKQRKKDLPEGSYTTKLLRSGSDRVIQKVGEEAIEVIIGAKNRDKKQIVSESADLIYHFLLMLVDNDIGFSEVIDELIKRRK